MNMERLLIAGDTHGMRQEHEAHIEWLCKEAVSNNCPAVFVVGDFGAWEHLGAGVNWFNRINEMAADHSVIFYWLDGNHDKTSLVLAKYGDQADDEGFLVCRSRIRYAPRGHRWTWDGVRFIALGGAYSVDKGWRVAQERHDTIDTGTDCSGTFWFPEEEMSDADMAGFLTDRTPVDVMLTHDKPRASNPSWNRKDIPECWPNQDRIQRAVTALQPKILVHGHLHFRYEDQILCGDGRYTQVVGLDADPYSAARMDPKHSRMVLTLADYA